MLLLCICFICPNVTLCYQTNSMKVETLSKLEFSAKAYFHLQQIIH